MNSDRHKRSLAAITQLPAKNFTKDQIILEQGGKESVLYFLNHGCVEVVKDGTQVAIVNEQGAPFGEIAQLMDCDHTASVKALDDCSLYYTEDPDAFLRDNPDTLYFVSVLLAERLRCVTAYLANVKAQFSDNNDHTAMLDEVLEGLLNKQSWNC